MEDIDVAQARIIKNLIDWMAHSHFSADMSLNQKDTFSDDHTRFEVTIEYDKKAYTTEYQCNLRYTEPTFAHVLSALVADAYTYEKYNNLADFADDMQNDNKLSTIITVWSSCERVNEVFAAWGIKTTKLLDYSNVLSEIDLDALDNAVSEFQVKLNPPAPEIEDDWSLTTDLMGEQFTGEIGDQLADYSGEIDWAISDLADGSVDLYTSDLHKWIAQPGSGQWIEQAKAEGMLEGVDDFDKMIMVAQYMYYSQDLYNNLEDSVRYAMFSNLADGGVYAIGPECADLLADIDCTNTNATLESVSAEALDVIEEHGGVMWRRGDKHYEIVPFVDVPPKPEAAYDLDSALFKAEQTAKDEQVRESSDTLQTSKDAR